MWWLYVPKDLRNAEALNVKGEEYKNADDADYLLQKRLEDGETESEIDSDKTESEDDKDRRH